MPIITVHSDSSSRQKRGPLCLMPREREGVPRITEKGKTKLHFFSKFVLFSGALGSVKGHHSSLLKMNAYFLSNCKITTCTCSSKQTTDGKDVACYSHTDKLIYYSFMDMDMDIG